MPDIAQLLVSKLIGALWWMIPLIVLVQALRSPWFKGHVGEWIVHLSAWLLLPSNRYASFRNVTLPTPDGTTQIDHIFVSQFGVFVVETKNMKGWIFGSERQAQWTQKIYRQSYRFQNPLRQNYKHVRALAVALGISADYVHSVVVFVGDSTFKTTMPPNVTAGIGFVRYIRSFSTSVFSQSEINDFCGGIASGRLDPSWKTHREHVRNLKSRADPGAKRRCPKCGKAMVLRTARRGANAGEQFWGCSGYPKCRTTRNCA